MEEKLIEAVKMQPSIYDKSCHFFRNKYLKDRAWQAVVAFVGVSGICMWKSLRDRFMREVADLISLPTFSALICFLNIIRLREVKELLTNFHNVHNYAECM